MSIPYTTHEISVPKEGKSYSVKIYQPHFFSIAINDLRPDLATFYAVNFGAGDGISCNDPVYPLFAMGYGGLAVEGENNTELEANLPSNKIVKLTGTYVIPENIGGILQNANCPQNPDFLKIDVDGYDASILNSILEVGYRPKVLQVEVNPEFPPPIEFFVHYDPKYRMLDRRGKIGGFYGVSMEYVVRTLNNYGYRLAHIDFVTGWTHDITFVYSDFLDIVSENVGLEIQQKSSREIFLSHPPCTPHFQEYGFDSLAWRHREDYGDLLVEIWDACLFSSLRKHQGRCVPFYLNISPRYLISGNIPTGNYHQAGRCRPLQYFVMGKLSQWLWAFFEFSLLRTLFSLFTRVVRKMRRERIPAIGCPRKPN
jgi:hypothetical protein